MTAFLLGFGMILIVLNIVAIKKEKSSFKYTLENTEKDMNDFQVEIGKIRKEIGESILDLQKEIEEIKSSLGSIKISENYKADEEEIAERIIENSNIETKEEQKLYEKENRTISKENSVKVEQIENMISSGMSVEEVSEKLNIGKGEVLLIKELYLK